MLSENVATTATVQTIVCLPVEQQERAFSLYSAKCDSHMYEWWVKYSSQLFTKYLQGKDCQQLDSTNTDTPLQALGMDETFYDYAKQSSNEQPVDFDYLPS